MTKDTFDYILANKEVTQIISKTGHTYCRCEICTSCPLHLNQPLEVKGYKSECAVSLFALSRMSDSDAEMAIALVNGFSI